MKYVLDIETNSLTNPDRIWVVVMKDIETGEYLSFYDLTKREDERERFIRSIDKIRHEAGSLLIGHNIVGYDWPILLQCLGLDTEACPAYVLDTLILSKLIDYSRPGGHSIESYGEEFGEEKIKHDDFTKYTEELETYCKRDVDICERIYRKHVRYINNPAHTSSIRLEHDFQCIANALHSTGFSFNAVKAEGLLKKVTAELNLLDDEILQAFPPKLKLIREITPKETKYGTINRTDFRWVVGGDLSEYNGGSFCRCHWDTFNPSSHKQIIRVLHDAGWHPVDKTQAHIDTERSLGMARRNKNPVLALPHLQRLEELKVSGWKVNETNLETLPSGAPKAARLLAKRIVYEARRRTLTEWLGLVADDGRIHGKFYAIGAWTHRMAHQSPNTANITNAVRVSDGKPTLLGKELRALWCAPQNKLLVGVDAEAIQLRVFAHLINDPILTNAILNGKKSDKSDPHSLNQKYFGEFCKTRNAAKHSLYAIFFGGGPSKIAEIMDCTKEEASQAINSLVQKYPGLQRLQQEVFPKDAKRGWFIGLDGRKVRIPGDEVSYRKHLAMSGYLQNGEAVCMKLATLKFYPKLKDYDARLVNLVHDEWQVECPNNLDIGVKIGKMMADSLVEVGSDLKLNCPLAGSYYNDDAKDYTIGPNWSVTH